MPSDLLQLAAREDPCLLQVSAALCGKLHPLHPVCCAHVICCVQVPEMQRCDLVGPILQLKALGISNLQACPLPLLRLWCKPACCTVLGTQEASGH